MLPSFDLQTGTYLQETTAFNDDSGMNSILSTRIQKLIYLYNFHFYYTNFINVIDFILDIPGPRPIKLKNINGRRWFCIVSATGGRGESGHNGWDWHRVSEVRAVLSVLW
jgi:hypothetical protein